MGIVSLFLVLAAADPAEGLTKKLLPVYRKEAAEYSMAVESAPRQKLEFKKEPVMEWSNPSRPGQGNGVLFLWLRQGRPAAIGCIFSQLAPRVRGRKVVHEFHALDRDKLLVRRPEGKNPWKPQVGLERKELPDAARPAATAGARLVQMRRLAQEFTGHEVDLEGKRVEMRLLPAPLYRYPAAKTVEIDGALFAFVSTEGTDPEVLLLIEARQQEDGKARWDFACARFSDRSLYMQRKDREVWTSIRSEATGKDRIQAWSGTAVHALSIICVRLRLSARRLSPQPSASFVSVWTSPMSRQAPARTHSMWSGGG
jgi:hypothetical protein